MFNKQVIKADLGKIEHQTVMTAIEPRGLFLPTGGGSVFIPLRDIAGGHVHFTILEDFRHRLLYKFHGTFIY